MSQPSFLGLNVTGKDRTQATIAYRILPTNGDNSLPNGGSVGPFNPWPNFGGPIYPYQILPQNNLGNFVFGNIRKVRVSITRPRSYLVSSTDQFYAGSDIIQLTGSGETLIFSPRQIVEGAPALAIPTQVFESDNLEVLTWLPATSQINFYLQSDTQIEAGPSTAYILPEFTSIIITMWNFNPDIV